MTETVLCKLEELHTILLQCAQKPAVLELDLILKAVAKIPDEVYVIFHFFLVCLLLHVTSTLPGVNEGLIVFRFKIKVVHLIFHCIHSTVQIPRRFIILIANCSRFLICVDLLHGH
jgi:hypothetical protein